MHNFKVGDVVRCINNEFSRGDLAEGKKYTVTYADNIFIELNFIGGIWQANRFELVEEKVSYTKADVERAMDVFEHFDIGRLLSNKYNSSQMDLGPSKPREEFLEKFFEDPTAAKVRELNKQIKELQTTVKELENQIEK